VKYTVINKYLYTCTCTSIFICGKFVLPCVFYLGDLNLIRFGLVHFQFKIFINIAMLKSLNYCTIDLQIHIIDSIKHLF